MPLGSLLLVAGAVGLAVAGFRDLKVLFAAQVAALVANLLLPLSAFGFAFTSQRLVALVAIGVCAALFLLGHLALPSPTAGQLAFLVTYGLIVAIHALHALRSPVVLPLSELVSAILNAILFYLAVTILHNLSSQDRRKLFHRWLPWIVVTVIALFIGFWFRDLVSQAGLDFSTFSQSYRLRNTGPRNIVNVWAAALVLTVPLVWLPLFERERSSRKLASILAVAVTSLAITLTFSRAALFGLIVLLSTGLLLTVVGSVAAGRRRSDTGWRSLAVPTLASLFTATVAWLALEWSPLPVASWVVDRLRPLFSGTDPSLQLRLAQYEAAAENLRSLPLLGFGPGSEAIPQLPENTLVLVLLYYGPLALSCLVGMLLLVGWRTAAWWWKRRQTPEAVPWPSAYVAFVALLLTNDFLFFSMGSLILATITFYTAERGPSSWGRIASYSAR